MSIKGLTFKGGVDMPGFKELTEERAIEKAKEPDFVKIALHQNIGAPCEPIVEVGEYVKVGQKIASTDAFVSGHVHSSVSGTVKEIIRSSTPTSVNVKTIVIESDKLNVEHEDMVSKGYLEDFTREDILSQIRNAGIVGMGGAGFPTHVKLSPPENKPIDTIIINGAECEPYLTGDHRIMLEETDKVIFGLRAIMKSLNVDNGVIGVELNKTEAIEALHKASKPFSNIKILPLKVKYPQGDEKRLIDATIGREVPSGGLPMDVKAVVVNISTTRAIAEAVMYGKPLYERIVTVTGKGIKNPKNLLVKIGTPLKELIEQCGGFTEDAPGKVISGGPMMGVSQYDLDVSTIKTTGGLLVLTNEEVKPAKITPCIRCGKCLEVCPVRLQPLYISSHSLKGNYDRCEEYSALDCVECGACSYICPAKRPLVESIRVAKTEIIASIKER